MSQVFNPLSQDGIDENSSIWKAIDTGGGQACDVRGALRELHRAGYVIVPVEPTKEMLTAAFQAEADAGGSTFPILHWRSMLVAWALPQ